MYFSVQRYVDCDYDFRKSSVKKMEPNFVRMKVPKSKKYLQCGESVLPISVAKNF